MCAWNSASCPHLQLQFSDVLTRWRRFFHQMAAEQGKAGLAAMDTKLEVAVLQVGLPGGRVGGPAGLGRALSVRSQQQCQKWVPGTAPEPAATPQLLGLAGKESEQAKGVLGRRTDAGWLACGRAPWSCRKGEGHEGGGDRPAWSRNKQTVSCSR